MQLGRSHRSSWSHCGQTTWSHPAFLPPGAKPRLDQRRDRSCGRGPAMVANLWDRDRISLRDHHTTGCPSLVHHSAARRPLSLGRGKRRLLCVVVFCARGRRHSSRSGERPFAHAATFAPERSRRCREAVRPGVTRSRSNRAPVVLLARQARPGRAACQTAHRHLRWPRWSSR
jgi:hypothetical protein